MKDKPIRYVVGDIDETIDATTTFYTKTIGKATLVIVPKESYKISETEECYILEMINQS